MRGKGEKGGSKSEAKRSPFSLPPYEKVINRGRGSSSREEYHLYPRIHALTSTLAVAVLSVISPISPTVKGIWIVLGFCFGVAIDIDHLIVIGLMKEKRHLVLEFFRSPVSTLMNLRSFIYRAFNFKRAKPIRMGFHLVETATIVYFFYIFLPGYMPPVLTALAVHIVFDIIHDVDLSMRERREALEP